MEENNTIQSQVVGGTLVILFVSVLAKFLSFISESILAAYLGTSEASDAYYMVSSIQGIIYPMISVGIWKVFLPIYKEKQSKQDFKGADCFANKSITLFTLISLGISVLLFLSSKLVVALVAPGYSPFAKALCARLVRISSPMYIFTVAAAIYATMLQSHNRFFGSQIREAVSHIPTIVAAVFFYSRFGVEALAVALIICGVLRLLIELPFVNWGYKYRPDFRFKSEDLGLLFGRIPSALLSTGVGRINTLVDKIIASTLPVGTVSALHYGVKLKNVFGGLVSDAIGTASYPQMIELIAHKKTEQLNQLIIKVLTIFASFIFPVTIACVLFREDLITVVYSHGSFDVSSVSVTSACFAFYCLCMMSSASNSVLNNLFYAYGDTRAPLIFSIINLLLNIIFNLIFVRIIDAPGLALATSLSSIICFAMRLVGIKKYIHLDYRTLSIVFMKLFFAGMGACFPARYVTEFYVHNVYLRLLAAAAIGILCYLILLRLLGIDALTDAVEMLKKKLKRGKKG